jgi:hypothetical protein
VEDEPETVKLMVQYFYELDYHFDVDTEGGLDDKSLIHYASNIQELSALPKKLAYRFPSHFVAMHDAVARDLETLTKVC